MFKFWDCLRFLRKLKKQLTGDNAVDDWIRFFNAKSREDLDMIHTKNAGERAGNRTGNKTRDTSLDRNL